MMQQYNRQLSSLPLTSVKPTVSKGRMSTLACPRTAAAAAVVWTHDFYLLHDLGQTMVIVVWKAMHILLYMHACSFLQPGKPLQ